MTQFESHIVTRLLKLWMYLETVLNIPVGCDSDTRRWNAGVSDFLVCVCVCVCVTIQASVLMLRITGLFIDYSDAYIC